MEKEVAALMSSGAQTRAASPGANGRCALVEEFPNTKSVFDPPSAKVDDGFSEHWAVEGPLSQLEGENKIVLDEAIVAKQTPKKHRHTSTNWSGPCAQAAS